MNDAHTSKPNLPLRTSEFTPKEYSEGLRFRDLTIPLGHFGGATQLGFHVVELPAGNQSCPFHYHMVEEEHFYILEGRCVLRSGETRHTMEAGDYVCFPAATKVAHALLNPFEKPCRMIVVGTKSMQEVAVYPDSGKALVRALGKLVQWPQEFLDYWDGEDTESPVTSCEPPA